MPTTVERMLPWLGAAVLAAGCTLAAVVMGFPLAGLEGAALLIALAGTLTAAGLVATRSTREVAAVDRDERARPAEEQLVDQGDDGRVDHPGPPAYLSGMVRWTTALLELLDRAAELATDPDRARELDEAAEDCRALHDLLRASEGRVLSLNESAMLRSVVSLWETDQDRLETLAAQVDPRWHRRWRARTVIERRLRHGRPRSGELVLPYRS